MIASLLPGLVSGLPPSPSVPASSAGASFPSCASVVPSVSLSASICPPPIIRVCRSARAPVPCAPSPASLGPCDANGEARAVNRHGTSPFVKRSDSRGSARVLQACCDTRRLIWALPYGFSDDHCTSCNCNICCYSLKFLIQRCFIGMKKCFESCGERDGTSFDNRMKSSFAKNIQISFKPGIIWRPLENTDPGLV